MKNIPKDKSFKNWTIEEILFQFGIREIYECELLNQWLSKEYPLIEFETQTLERLHEKAVKKHSLLE